MTVPVELHGASWMVAQSPLPGAPGEPEKLYLCVGLTVRLKPLPAVMPTVYEAGAVVTVTVRVVP